MFRDNIYFGGVGKKNKMIEMFTWNLLYTGTIIYALHTLFNRHNQLTGVSTVIIPIS